MTYHRKTLRRQRINGPEVEKHRQHLSSFLRRRLADTKAPRTKHGRLKSAILAAIEKGVLNPGDQLPPEPDLAAGTGLSLGTIRRCLTRMAEDGIVSREHGRGTFISVGRPLLNDLWHIRFLNEDGSNVLPAYHRILSQGTITEKGPWSAALGPSVGGYVRILRAVNVDSRFLCFSAFYVSADRFPSLPQTASADLETTGMKHVLAIRCDAPITRIAKTIQCLPAPPDISDMIGLDADDTAMLVTVVGYAHDDRPISFQNLWIPPIDVPMDVTSGPAAPETNRRPAAPVA